MKIAAITDDGKSISLHFGRAQHYLVATVEDGQIVDRELRDKISHTHFHSEGHGHEESDKPHGYGPAADYRHGRMAEAIADCEAVLCRGMGMGAYENLKLHHILPVITDIADIDEAIRAYAKGQLENHIEKLH